MRILLALVAVALGCSDPSLTTGDAAAAACGDPPDGQVWRAEPGCRPTCALVNGAVRNQPCPIGDAGAIFCAPLGDIHNCGACGHDCPTTECRPFNGATYSSTCIGGACNCTRTD